MRIEIFEFTVPIYVLSAIVNSDRSGLTDSDEIVLEEMEDDVKDISRRYNLSHGHFSIPDDIDEAKYFGRCEYTNLGSTLIDIEYVGYVKA